MRLTESQKKVVDDFQSLLIEIGGDKMQNALVDIHMRDGKFWFGGLNMKVDGVSYIDKTTPDSNLSDSINEVMGKINAQ